MVAFWAQDVSEPAPGAPQEFINGAKEPFRAAWLLAPRCQGAILDQFWSQVGSIPTRCWDVSCIMSDSLQISEHVFWFSFKLYSSTSTSGMLSARWPVSGAHAPCEINADPERDMHGLSAKVACAICSRSAKLQTPFLDLPRHNRLLGQLAVL